MLPNSELLLLLAAALLCDASLSSAFSRFSRFFLFLPFLDFFSRLLRFSFLLFFSRFRLRRRSSSLEPESLLELLLDELLRLRRLERDRDRERERLTRLIESRQEKLVNQPRYTQIACMKWLCTCNQ